jgi:hypothetical protein
MAALLWIAAALIGVVLLVLLTPWHVRFRGRTMPLDLQVASQPSGRAGPRHPDPDPPVEGPRPTAEEEAQAAQGPPLPRHATGPAGPVFGLLSALRLRNLRLSGRIGLPTRPIPARSGARSRRSSTASGPHRHRRIDIAPEFSGACLDLDGSGDLVIRPTRLLRAGLAFAWANRGWR